MLVAGAQQGIREGPVQLHCLLRWNCGGAGNRCFCFRLSTALRSLCEADGLAPAFADDC